MVPGTFDGQRLIGYLNAVDGDHHVPCARGKTKWIGESDLFYAAFRPRPIAVVAYPFLAVFVPHPGIWCADRKFFKLKTEVDDLRLGSETGLVV